MKRPIIRAVMPTVLISASLALLVSCVGFVYARPSQQPSRQSTRPPSQDEELLARNSINRTNDVLQDAQISVRNNKRYTGNLASAYSNQQYARELYNRSAFHSAIEYTLYARRLAYQALDANRQKYIKGRYDDESRFRSRGDGQLRDDLRRAHPDSPTDDRAVLSFSIQFGI